MIKFTYLCKTVAKGYGL